ncbi:hypothetical protein [Paenibacillus sp. SYP-B3998]|nr:hypothetical protein [Paenibacillus sp. SYP-B3998]
MVGFVLVLRLVSFFEEKIKQQAQQTYEIHTLDIYLIYFFLGVYIAIPLIRRWKLKINLPLAIIILLPCFVLSFFQPINILFNLNPNINILATVSGLLFLYSIFKD